MDEATFISLLDRQEKNLREFITGANTLQNARMINRIDPITEKLSEVVKQNAVRNNRIDKLENQTGLFRWMHRNPRLSIPIILILFVGLAYGYHKIDVSRTFENKTGIYIKDTSTNTVTRK